MYPVNFTEKMSVNLTHAHTVCTRPSLSQREGPGDEASLWGDYFHDQRVKLRIANVGNGRQTCVPLESTKISAETGKVNKLSWHHETTTQ